MKICDEVKENSFIAGNLYVGKASGILYIATGKEQEKISITTGKKEFSSFDCFDDVTDQYCLQKIK